MNTGIYWDTVLNQNAGADSTEKFTVVKVDPEGDHFSGNRGKTRVHMKVNNLVDRNTEIYRPLTIAGWVGFDFLGRGEKYSSMKYHRQYFAGLDWDDASQQHAI
ncbi:Glycoside hydrolase superfamily [Penicillium robsamsonii]|uniref:Glycoside hydrolase superfamily n=1 Tax=Penicillium robsamsonii TaxID=1792511 RepID=UPI0025481E88|nr:Glycoside hydrolase superfamily [Penicillium robsamsonii]KAJ5826682.1 Glycoside hydrolase superfamily [Penicillium robsamsonii]